MQTGIKSKVSKLVIITPSYINSRSRCEYARRSLQSLHETAGLLYDHIIVDDYPRGKNIFSHWYLKKRFGDAATRIYNRPHMRLIRRNEGGSTSATLCAVRAACQQGGKYVFIHLDDNVYVDQLGPLLKYACQALENDEQLMQIRMSAFPLISRYCNSKQGNKTSLNIDGCTVRFDKICLQSTDFNEFTLWWSFLTNDMAAGEFWPIALWTTVYRIDYLEQVLTFKEAVRKNNLGEVEEYYTNNDVWQQFIKNYPGKLGFINMQYAGIEMEHNRDWRDLMKLPNEPVRVGIPVTV
ncbi:MAG: hypothetical protein JW860_03005 [Sedimentisphaerales bacterium]|nr:hypothetical protein [Sedimentisphaerales bacterium]